MLSRGKGAAPAAPFLFARLARSFAASAEGIAQLDWALFDSCRLADGRCYLRCAADLEWSKQCVGLFLQLVRRLSLLQWDR